MSETTPGHDAAHITFEDLGLPVELLRATKDLGYVTPSAIQEQAIPVLLGGRDITGIAQTGTGKTAAFGLPMLAGIDADEKAVQALVLTPTRELAMQVADAITDFARHIPGLSVVPVYGGAPYPPQIAAIKSGAQVVVGTPGRVIDHLDRGVLKLGQLRFLVLDEADEMLRMGFAEDVEHVFESVPEQRQVALFSATMPPAIRHVAAQHLDNPVEVAVSRQSSTVEAVTQQYAIVPFRHKTGALARVLATHDSDAAIVFCRTRGSAEEVGSALIAQGVAAATISGDVPQAERERIVERLRAGSVDVLVATDVAARGLDVDRIGLVVNFDIPREVEAYVHRIGRTGRAGRTGTALSFVTPAEQSRVKNIQRVTKVPLELVDIPSPADVSEHKAKALLKGAPERLERGRLALYDRLVEEFMSDGEISQRELLSVLVALAVGDNGPLPREEADHDDLKSAAAAALRRESRGERGDGDKGRNGPRGGRREHGASGTRYRIAVGSNHGANPGGIVGAITGESGIRGHEVGKIAIFNTFSLVDISANLSEDQLSRLHRAHIVGRQMRLSLDKGPGGSGGGKRDFRDNRDGFRKDKGFKKDKTYGKKPGRRSHSEKV